MKRKKDGETKVLELTEQVKTKDDDIGKLTKEKNDGETTVSELEKGVREYRMFDKSV
jgi:cell division protein FtsB